MKRRTILQQGAGILVFGTAFGKRKAAPQVPHLVHKGFRYEASRVDCGVVYQMALSDPEKRRSIMIYPMHYEDSLERDVQDIWIKTMFLKDDSLWVLNERGQVFEYGSITHKIQAHGKMTEAEFLALKPQGT